MSKGKEVKGKAVWTGVRWGNNRNFSCNPVHIYMGVSQELISKLACKGVSCIIQGWILSSERTFMEIQQKETGRRNVGKQRRKIKTWTWKLEGFCRTLIGDKFPQNAPLLISCITEVDLHILYRHTTNLLLPRWTSEQSLLLFFYYYALHNCIIKYKQAYQRW